MTVADGQRAETFQQTGVLTAHVLTPWAPMVIRWTVAVLPGGDDVMILNSKALREQLNIDIMEGLRAKPLIRDERADSGHGLTAVSDAGSTVSIGLRRVAVSAGAMQTTTDAGEGPNAVEDSFIDNLLARGPGIVTENELEWEKRVQARTRR